MFIILYLDYDNLGRRNFFPYSLLSSPLLLLLRCLISFSVLHARVFGNTLVHEFLISYSRTERYFFFPTVQLQVHNVYSERKTRNS